jgi:CheY-like chemotaxis protein
MGVPSNISDQPAEYRTLVTPTISSTPTPSVVINGSASAGSRHIDDATPTLTEILTEQIHWVFDAADNVRLIVVTLEVEGRLVTAVSSTAGAVELTHEARGLRVTVNPGDDVQAATRLLAGYPDVINCWPNQPLQIAVSAAITDVYACATLSDVASAIQTGARARCVGYSYA